jgi:nitronate monooxygenase
MAGQGVGQIQEIVPVADVVARLKREYDEARQRISA